MKSQRQLNNSDLSDSVSTLQNEFQEKYQSCLVTFYIALHYILEQSTRTALPILSSCQYKIEEAIEYAQTNGLKGVKFEGMINELGGDLLKNVEYALCKSHAKVMLAEMKGE